MLISEFSANKSFSPASIVQLRPSRLVKDFSSRTSRLHHQVYQIDEFTRLHFFRFQNDRSTAFFGLLLFFIACSAGDTPKADALTRYLEGAFSLTIPDSLHFYLFIPAGGCSGCVAFATEQHERVMFRDNVTVMYLDYGETEARRDTMRRQVYHGSADEAYYRYDIFAYSVRLYETNNSEMKIVYEITAKNIEQIFRKTILKPVR